MTHWVIAVLVDELVNGNVVGVELRASVVPTYNVLTSWRERETVRGMETGRRGGSKKGEQSRQTKRERDSERDGNREERREREGRAEQTERERDGGVTRGEGEFVKYVCTFM